MGQREDFLKRRKESKERRGAQSASSSFNQDSYMDFQARREALRLQREKDYIGDNRPSYADLDLRTSEDKIRDYKGMQEVYRRTAGRSKEISDNITNPEKAENNYRYNSIVEYDNALKEAELSASEKLDYKRKKATHAMENTNSAIPVVSELVDLEKKITGPIRNKLDEVFGYNRDTEYSDKERYYEDLKAEKDRFVQEHVWDDYAQQYADYGQDTSKSALNEFLLNQGDMSTWNRMSVNAGYLNQEFEKMTDDEKRMANYIYKTEGSDAFYKYMQDMDVYVSRRDYQKTSQAKQDRTGSFGKDALLTAEAYGRNFVGSVQAANEYATTKMDNLFGGDRQINPYSGGMGWVNLANDEVAAVTQDIDEATKDNKALNYFATRAYGDLYSMAGSLGGGLVFGPGYSVLMGTSAGTVAYKEALENGATREDAEHLALLSGAIETAFEYISLENLLNPEKVTAKWIKKALIQAGIEASEEFNTEIANIFANTAVLGTRSDIEKRLAELQAKGYTKEQAESMVKRELEGRVIDAARGGFVSGFFLGGGTNMLYHHQLSKYGAGIDRQALENSLGEDVKNSLKKEYGDNWSSKVSNAEIAAIYINTMTDLNKVGAKAAQQAATDAIAKTYNVSKEEAAKYAKALYNESATNKEKGILDSHFGSIIVEDLTQGKGWTKLARNNETVNQAENAVNDLKASRTTAAAKAQQAGFSIADKTSVNGKDAKITGLKKDGKNLIVVTDQGEVKGNDKGVKFSNQDAQLIAMASEFRDERMANAFVANYKGQDIDTYANDMKLAYAYGSKEGLGINELKKDIPNFNIDSESIINMYEAGVAARNAIDNEAKKANEEIRKNYSGTFRKGTFTSDVKVENLNSTERQLYLMAQSFSDMGINVKVIHDTDKNSKNGEYDKNTNTVTINLAARYSKNGDPFDRHYAINTMAHELTHWMEVNAAEEFAALKGMIWEYFDRTGIDTEKLIHDEMKSGISRKAAESEVMARACEDMLSNPDTYAQITANANKSFHEKFREAVLKVLDKIKNLLNRMMKGYGSNATAATFVRQNQEAFEKFREQWIKTFDEALKFNQALNENIAKNRYESEDKNDKINTENKALFNQKSIESGNEIFFRDTLIFEGKEGKYRKSQFIRIRNDRDNNAGLYIKVGKGKALYILKDALLVTNTSQNPIISRAYFIQVEELEEDSEDVKSWTDPLITTFIEMERSNALDDEQKRKFSNLFSQLYAQVYRREVAINGYYRDNKGSLYLYQSISGSGTVVGLKQKVGFDTHSGGLVTDFDGAYFSNKVDSEGRELTEEQQTFYADESPLLLTKDGAIKRYFHGTARKDRIGNMFDPARATSGPMAFFTDNKGIAENYAKDKADTSLSRDERYNDYFTQFRIDYNGKDISIPELWNKLPLSKRNEIAKKAEHVHFDDDYENIVYDEDNKYGNGAFSEYEIKRNKGNYLQTLVSTWLETGDLLDREADFLDVLKLVGIDNATYLDPSLRDEGVFEVYLHVTNPLDTTDIPKNIVDALKEKAQSIDWTEPDYSADFWDKSSIEPMEWIDRLERDLENNTTHAWTSIPDFVTETLIEHGYDGISDMGGKGGGTGHQVVIPFRSNQVKDINNLNPTDDPIMFNSLKADDDRIFYTASGVEVVQNPTSAEYNQMREDILKEYPWLRGTGEPLFRHTYDEEGNEYYWEAGSGLHSQIEPEINKHYNTRTSQQYRWWEQPDKDDYPRMYSNKVDSEGNDLTEEQQTYFEKSQIRDDDGNLLVMYHGTDAYEDFTVFKPGKYGYLGKGMYFSASENYAKRYSEQNGYKGRIYKVYLNVTNPLVVTSDNPAAEILGEKVAAKRAAKNSYSTRWLTSADIKKLQDKGYDGIIWKYGKSPVEVSVWDPSQIKLTTNENPTDNPDIRFSDKVDDEYNELASRFYNVYEEEKKAFSGDVKRLTEAIVKRKVNLEDLNDRKLGLAADALLKEANSTYDRDELIGDLFDTYRYIVEGATYDGNVDWDAMMGRAYDTADKILSKAKAKTAKDGFYSEIIKSLKNTRVHLNDAQIAELKSQFDKDWNKVLFGKIRMVKDPAAISLDSLWHDLSHDYPDIFKQDVSDTDQPLMLIEAINDLNTLAEQNARAESQMDTVTLAESVYEKFWNIAILDTSIEKAMEARNRNALREQKIKAEHDLNAQKEFYEQKSRIEASKAQAEQYEAVKRAQDQGKQAVSDQKLADDIFFTAKERKAIRDRVEKDKQRVKELVAQHRQAMKELTAAKNTERRTAVNQNRAEQKLADSIYYGKIFAKYKEKKAEDMRKYKEYVAKKAEERKEEAQRRAVISDITDMSKTLADWMRENGKKHRVPEPLKRPVGELLNAIDYSSKRLLGLTQGENAYVPTKKDISMGRALERVRDIVARANKGQTSESIDDAFNGYIDFPPQYADDLTEISERVNEIERKTKDGAYVLQAMSLDDLIDLKEIVKVMKHTVSKMNSLISQTNAHSVDYYAQDTINFADENAKELKDRNRAGQIAENAAKFAGGFINFTNGLPYYVFKHMGDGSKYMFSLLQNGWDKFAFNIKSIADFTEELYTDKEVKEWTQDVHDVTVLEVATDEEKAEGKENTERSIKLTTAQIMSLYCLAKREQAKGHILGGGVRIADFKDEWRTISQSKAVTLTESELARITDMLTDRQKEVADELQKFMNTTCSEWGNEVTMKRFGIKAFTEENYFPIKSDTNVLRADVRDDVKSIYALLNMSFTKELVKNANNQIVVDDIFNVFTVHASDMAKYNSLALPVLDTIKWWSYSEKDKRGEQAFTTRGVKTALANAYGNDANKYIRNLLSDINGAAESGRYDKGFSKMTKRYKTAAVGANLSVALLQPISYARAIYNIDKKYLVKGLAKKPSIEKCKQYAGIALWKSLGFYDTNINMGLDKIIKHADKTGDKLVDLSLKLAEMGDSLTWGYLWNAVEAEISDTRNLAYGSEAFNEAVAERLREILYSTQVFDSTLSRSDIMRAKGMAQPVTAFMSEPTVTVNMMNDARIDFQREASKNGLNSAMRKHGKQVANACEAYVLTATLEAVVRSVLDKLRDHDDDETFLETFIAELKDALNPFGKIPYLKDIVELSKGYKPTRMDVSYLQSIVDAFSMISKVPEKGWTYKTTYKLMQAIGQATGLPLSNAMRELATLWNNTIGRMYPDLQLNK